MYFRLKCSIMLKIKRTPKKAVLGLSSCKYERNIRMKTIKIKIQEQIKSRKIIKTFNLNP